MNGRFPGRIPLLILLVLFGLAGRPALAASEPVVEGIKAQVESASRLSAPLRARLEASVARVAERLLLGRSLAQFEKERGDYERIIAEVFARILGGYRVEGVEIEIPAGREARVTVRLSPEGQRIEEVRFFPRLAGLAAPAVMFLREELAAHEASFAALFLDVPLAAFAWAEPILVAGLKETFEALFPGFHLEIHLTPGTLLQVELAVSPALPKVEKVAVELVAQNLPRLLALRWTEKARACCAMAETLPLAYVRRYQLALERRCVELLAAEEITRRFDLVWRVRLFPGPITQARVEVGAGHYSLAVLGEFVLEEEAFLAARLQTGVRPWPGWEILGEFWLATDRRGPGFSGSLLYSLSPETALGFTQVFGAQRRLLWLRYKNNGVSFGVEKELDAGPFSASVALVTEEGFTVRFTANSVRDYCLAFIFSF